MKVTVDLDRYRKDVIGQADQYADDEIDKRDRSKTANIDPMKIADKIVAIVGKSKEIDAFRSDPTNEKTHKPLWDLFVKLYKSEDPESDKLPAAYAVSREFMDYGRSIAGETDDEIRKSYRESAEDVIGKTEKIANRMERMVSDAARRIDDWVSGDIMARPSYYTGYREEVPIEPLTSFFVEIGSGSIKPGFSLFLKDDGALSSIDDVLDGGDYDYFPPTSDPMRQANYFDLISEIKKPGSSRTPGKNLTLYTARPTKDRSRYEKAKEVPINIFLANDIGHVEGLAHDLSSKGARDIWKVVINERDVILTNDAGRVKYYQVVGKGPTIKVSKMELVAPGMEESVEINEAKEPYDLSAMIRPTTQTAEIVKRAIIQASAGKIVELGNPAWRFWYDDRRGQWGVSAPMESYPRFFDGTDQAATFFVKSWVAGRVLEDVGKVVTERQSASPTVARWEEIEDDISKLVRTKRGLSDEPTTQPFNEIPAIFVKIYQKYMGTNLPTREVMGKSQYAAAEVVIDTIRNIQRDLIRQIANDAVREMKMKYGIMAQAALGKTGIHGDTIAMFMVNPSTDPIGYDMARERLIAKINDASKLYKDIMTDYLALFPKRAVREYIESKHDDAIVESDHHEKPGLIGDLDGILRRIIVDSVMPKK